MFGLVLFILLIFALKGGGEETRTNANNMEYTILSNMLLNCNINNVDTYVAIVIAV